mgnify:CR=1 FL=1
MLRIHLRTSVVKGHVLNRSVMLGFLIAVLLFVALSYPVLSQCDQPFIGDGVEALYYNEGMDPTSSPNSMERFDSVRFVDGTRVIYSTYCTIRKDTCLYSNVRYVTPNGSLFYSRADLEDSSAYLNICAPIDSVIVNGNVLRKRIGDRWTVLFGDYRPFKTFLSWTVTQYGDTLSNYDMLVSDTFGIIMRYDPENGQVVSRLVAAVINGKHYGNPVSVGESIITGDRIQIRTDDESIVVSNYDADCSKEYEVTVSDYSGRVSHSHRYVNGTQLRITDNTSTLLFISVRDVRTQRQVASRILLNPRLN